MDFSCIFLAFSLAFHASETTHNVIRPLISKGLVTNYGEGGLPNGRGAHVKFYPYKKRGGGAEKVLAMLKGGHKKYWSSFYAVVRKF